MNHKIFIGSSSEGKQIVNALQAVFQNNGAPYDIIPWHQGVFGLSDTTIESLEKELDKVDFAILVLTPDDETVVRGEKYMVPRDNISFELGLFVGRLGRKKTIIVCEEDTKLPSDLYGVTVAYFKKNNEKKWTNILNPVVFSIDEHISTLLQDEILENNLRITAERIIRRAQPAEGSGNIDMSGFSILPRVIKLISEQDYIIRYSRTVIVSPNETGTKFQIDSDIIRKLLTNDDSYPGSVHWFVSEQNRDSIVSEKFIIDDIDMTEERKQARVYMTRKRRDYALSYGVKYEPINYPNKNPVHTIEYETLSYRNCSGLYQFSTVFPMLVKEVDIDIQLGGPYAHKWALSVYNFTAFDYPHSVYSDEYIAKSISLAHVSLRYSGWTLPGSGYVAIVRPRIDDEEIDMFR